MRHYHLLSTVRMLTCFNYFSRRMVTLTNTCTARALHKLFFAACSRMKWACVVFLLGATEKQYIVRQLLCLAFAGAFSRVLSREGVGWVCSCLCRSVDVVLIEFSVAPEKTEMFSRRLIVSSQTTSGVQWCGVLENVGRGHRLSCQSSHASKF